MPTILGKHFGELSVGDVEQLVAEKRLLPDLRWRIGEFVITVPPLKGRFVDIAALAYHFLDRVREEFPSRGPIWVAQVWPERRATVPWSTAGPPSALRARTRPRQSTTAV